MREGNVLGNRDLCALVGVSADQSSTEKGPWMLLPRLPTLEFPTSMARGQLVVVAHHRGTQVSAR